MDILYVLFCIFLFLGSAVAMEGVAWFTHKYVMHGFLWVLHKDHHVPHKGPLEKNDLFVVFFALPAIVFLLIGINQANWLLISTGAGISAYGIGYTLFHDFMFHRRLRWLKIPAFNSYLQRMIDAHRVHHRSPERRPGDAFGFLYAPKHYEKGGRPTSSKPAVSSPAQESDGSPEIKA